MTKDCGRVDPSCACRARAAGTGEKAEALPVDALILDFEVPSRRMRRSRARGRVRAAAASGELRLARITIRVNSQSEHGVARRRLTCHGRAARRHPRAEGRHRGRGSGVEKGLEAGGAPDHTLIWAMVETPIAVLPRVRVTRPRIGRPSWSWGRRSRQGCTRSCARSPAATDRTVALPVAARAAGKVILDGVYNDIRTTKASSIECEPGSTDGLRRQTLIRAATGSVTISRRRR